jgi:hypothetical protein
VRARNGAGADPTPAVATVVADRTAAQTAIVDQPSSWYPYATSTPSFTVTTEAGAAISCKWDDRDWTPCGTGPQAQVTAPALGEGWHRLEARSTDALGNTPPGGPAINFVVDTIAPPIALTRGPAAISSDRNPEFDFDTGDNAGRPDGANWECKLDGAPVAGRCPWLQDVPLGAHLAEFRVRDLAGNWSPWVSRSWTIVPGPAVTGVTVTPALSAARVRALVKRCGRLSRKAAARCRADATLRGRTRVSFRLERPAAVKVTISDPGNLFDKGSVTLRGRKGLNVVTAPKTLRPGDYLASVFAGTKDINTTVARPFTVAR